MYKNYLISEIKKWIGDPIMAFLLIFPVMLALAVRFGVPYAEKQFSFSLEAWYHIILAGLMMMTALLTGAIIGFSVLDDRDDKVLYAIDVSPVSFDFFMVLRLVISFLLTFVSIIAAVLIADIGSIPLYALLLTALSISFFSSLSAMVINSIASNKVEGFAIMKSTGLIIVLPVASMFFKDFKEFFFSFEPNFWSVKALSTAMLPNTSFNLSFLGYYSVGLVYILILNLLMYKVFKKRVMR